MKIPSKKCTWDFLYNIRRIDKKIMLINFTSVSPSKITTQKYVTLNGTTRHFSQTNGNRHPTKIDG